MSIHKVRSKQENFRLWRDGYFGPRLPIWRSVDEWLASDLEDPVAFRQLGSAGGGLCTYNVTKETAPAELARWAEAGVSKSHIMINAMAPQNHARLQGELWTGADRMWWARLATGEGYMRDVLPRATVTEGTATLARLRRALWPRSYKWLMFLAEQFPEHAIEFTSFDEAIVEAGNNLLVWEVRQY